MAGTNLEDLKMSVVSLMYQQNRSKRCGDSSVGQRDGLHIITAAPAGQIQAKQDSNLQDVDAWDPNADLLDSDDDSTRDALTGAPTAPGSEPGTAPASRQQKKRSRDKAHSTVCVCSCVSPCVCARSYVCIYRSFQTSGYTII